MPELIVSLDIAERKEAEAVVEKLGSSVMFYKVGIIPFTAFGPKIIRWLTLLGKRVFLDLKFFDIPNTVENAVKSACDMGVELLTVHILGGSNMLKTAIKARNTGNTDTKIIGVTILTSFSDNDIKEIGLYMDINNHILKLTELGYKCGIDGIVCSVHELNLLREKFRHPFLMVCPGIRIKASGDDQKRTATVSQAVSAGADYLVVGRPIIKSEDPLLVVEQIKMEMKKNEKK
ncbi:MAG TPA: orotidine-5'-phosphate decarboxylase [Candidatus Ratteibacteria bacterium]|nr:orotidine-5'-phosphate decarboxylase [bacterium]HRS05513.1 orotidine-5'-phosphate decarboxylase [Candidatus Ratteibacteria bacterium]HON05411.1 orotidine-5'-phosphate decarboxylase [bacterium]HOQ81633.1 orotidine-5'-phosphate decarboxylase [bacterium]HPC28782.1 orotidine-5'-phosphate decarboxylase [bacterium]